MKNIISLISLFCYISYNFTCKLDFSASEQSFGNDEFEIMYKFFRANIDIAGSGEVAAAPQDKQEAGDYYYHWSRDAALSNYALMYLNNFELSKISTELDNYATWVQGLQTRSSPHNIDIRVEVKYEIPSGEVYKDGWCRPQNDAPGLRAMTLMKYANILIENGHKDKVSELYWTKDSSKNGGIIPYDLDYIVDHYSDTTCDLWEEIQSTSLFWNLYTTRKALYLGSKLAYKMMDLDRANKYSAAVSALETKIINEHWNGAFLLQDQNRQIDASVIHAISVGFLETIDDSFLAVTDQKVANTVHKYNQAFCDEYPINRTDDGKTPGILYGRYTGDNYKGGNPWILTSASLAQLFYNIAIKTKLMESIPAELVASWSETLPKLSKSRIGENGAYNKTDVYDSFVAAGDSILQRLYYHSVGSGFHLYEQLDKNTGFMASAPDLTWSYANVLSAVNTRMIIKKNDTIIIEKVLYE